MNHHRVLRTPGEHLAIRWTPRTVFTVTAALSVALAAGLLCIFTGNRAIDFSVVSAILLGDYSVATQFETFTVLDNRLPRALCAILAGAAFGISGAIFQRLTENPLGSPDLIGFSDGAATGALLVIVLGTSVALGVAAGALLGGVAAVLAVYALAWRRGIEGHRLIVVGIAIGAVLTSASAYLLSRMELLDATTAFRWLVGGVTGRSWPDATLAVIGVAILLPGVIYLHRGLDALSVGAELALSQGLNVNRFRITGALVGTGFVAVAICVAGPVGFVALASPHIARLVSRSPGPVLAASAAVGAAILVSADLIAAQLMPTRQIPAGVITAIIGGLYVVWLLQHRRKEGSL